MKDDVKDLIFEDTKYGTRHNAKMIYSDNNDMMLKIYEKTSVIKRLRYVGENIDCDPDKIRYKQIV